MYYDMYGCVCYVVHSGSSEQGAERRGGRVQSVVHRWGEHQSADTALWQVALEYLIYYLNLWHSTDIASAIPK